MIFEFNGGLGNQMFQYAFYLSLKNRCPNLKYECYLKRKVMEKSHYGYELQKVFGINIDETGWLNSILANRFYRKFPLLYQVIPDMRQGYDKEVYKKINDRSFVRGSWQSEKYFKEISTQIREAFTFSPMTDVKNIEMQKVMDDSESVSIHVRRGDYLKHPSLYMDLTKQKYYQRAIQYINANVKNPKWFIFSDDIGWCKDNLEIRDAVYADHNTGVLSCNDMQLMSMCKHNIIANSTFSWWGAWLNRNKNKIVISPDIFLKDYKQLNQDIICVDWKVINV